MRRIGAAQADATWIIPSEDEWYKVAYYKGGGIDAGYWDYPTQSDTIPTPEAPPGTDLVNGSANYLDGAFVDPTYHTTEVGTYDAKPSDSPYGTFDQGGKSPPGVDARPSKPGRTTSPGWNGSDASGRSSTRLWC